MLVDENTRRASWVDECLTDLGFQEVRIVSDRRSLLKEISNWQPDVVVIDMESPDRDILESLSIVSSHNPTPIVMFSQEQDPAYIARAVDAGVSTYIVDGLQPDKVKPIIDVALLQFRSFQQLRRERDDARSELTERREIERAKYLLMEQLSLDEDAAYKQMREVAMKQNLRMIEVAQKILAGIPKERAP